MKKLILIATMVMLFPFVGNAQLKVESKQDAFVTIASCRIGCISLEKNHDIYMISIVSSNSFDPTSRIYLGRGKESSVLTLKDIIGLFDSTDIGDSVVVKDAADQSININRLNKPSFMLTFPKQAGFSIASKRELTKLLSALLQEK